MLTYEGMRQRGCIVFGAGLNARAWVDAAKAEGYSVMIRDGYAELWSPLSRAEREGAKKTA